GRHHASGSTSGAARRHAARCGAGGARARGTSPGRRGSAASTATAATTTAGAATTASTAAAAAAGGGSTAQAKAGATGSSDHHVIVPKFRLHSLFSSGDSTAPEVGGGVTTFGTGSRRKRPAGKATAASGAESIAPPQPPRGGREAGFLEHTKGSLVRSSHTVFGSDYDLDDEDCAFLEQLNAINSSSGSNSSGGGVGGSSSTNRPIRSRSARNQGGSAGGGGSGLEERGWAMSEDLFEAMIERLE
ncbi:unnamed protein product, partial [Laminaria digitata]